MGQTVKNRQHEKREQRGRKNPADHYGGQGTLDFSAGARRNGHGNEAQRGHQGSHQHGAQPGQRAIPDRFVKSNAALPQAADIGNHHQPVEHCHPRERDEANGRGDGHRNVPKPQRQDAPCQCEWDAGEDQQTVLGIAEHREQQHEDQQQGDRYNDLQALGG